MTASVLAIALGASLGALLRWCLSFTFNPFFPTIPPGYACSESHQRIFHGDIHRGHAIFPLCPSRSTRYWS